MLYQDIDSNASVGEDLSSTTFVAVPHQVSVDIDGEAAVLDLQNGIYFALNEVATMVWNLLATPQTIGHLQQAITDVYDVSDAEARRDLLQLLGELRDEGLIIVAVASPKIANPMQ